MTEDFETLLAASRGPVERYIRFHVANPADAEDLFQEVCLAAWRSFDRLRDRERFRAWILQIARNRVRDYYRAQAGARVISLETLPETALTWGRLGLSLVGETLETLEERDRRLLCLVYDSHLPQQEIAQALGIPLGTVKSRLHTARARFRAAYPGLLLPGKGETPMKKLPDILPNYTIESSAQPPFAVRWEEIMGWFIVPRLGQSCSWAMYDLPSRKRTMTVELNVAGRARVHGLEGVEIHALERDPAVSEQLGKQNPVQRRLVAQLTDTHCRLLAESHTAPDGEKLYYTFLDGDEFLENWGFGPDNCGNEVSLSPKGLLRWENGALTVADTPWPLDVLGRYTVTIGGKCFDTVCVWDIGCYSQQGACSQQFLDQAGRTVLWRRFNRDDWALERFEGGPWSQRLPDNERIVINGRTYIHWYDCITDYIL